MASISGSLSNSSYDPYAFGIPRLLAACCAFSKVRDAMAVTSDHSLCCMAGITFTVAILATPRTPHFTFLRIERVSHTADRPYIHRSDIPRCIRSADGYEYNSSHRVRVE